MEFSKTSSGRKRVPVMCLNQFSFFNGHVTGHVRRIATATAPFVIQPARPPESVVRGALGPANRAAATDRLPLLDQSRLRPQPFHRPYHGCAFPLSAPFLNGGSCDRLHRRAWPPTPRETAPHSVVLTRAPIHCVHIPLANLVKVAQRPLHIPRLLVNLPCRRTILTRLRLLL